MKTLFDSEAHQEILNRIGQLTASSQRRWGKMDVAQMLAHCVEPIDLSVSQKKVPRRLLGYLLGPFAKPMMVNDKPYKQGLPTDKSFVVTDTRNFEEEKAKLVAIINRFYQAGEQGVTLHPHPFFGTMTPDDWGKSTYKHLDHHLQQFGV